MTDTPTLTLHILRLAASQSDAIAVQMADGAVSYGQLADLALAYALHLRAQGIGQGGLVAVPPSDPVTDLAAVLGCGLLGARRVALTPWAQNRFAGRIGAVLAAPFLAGKPDPFAPVDPDSVWLIFPDDPADPDSAPVALSHRLVGARIGAAIAAKVPSEGAVACLLPATSAECLLVRLAILAQGGTVVTTDAAAQAQIVCAPDAPARDGACVLLADPRHGLHLPDDPDLVAIFATPATGPITTLVRANGQTRSVLSPHHRAAIVDDDGHALPVGSEGILCLRGPLVAPDATTPEGWHITGLLAKAAPDGGLDLTRPRKDHFVLPKGIVSAALVDMAMRGVDGIADAMCFLLPRPDKPLRLTAFLSFKAGIDSAKAEAEVRIQIIRIAGLHALPEKFLMAPVLPRTPDGSPDREGCARLVLSTITARRARR